ncbi:hypothetical protein FQA39_LY02078 [Lamprigera yunnana]|nr:hypothetical protein FQA39_LY02078 [Lamprigera yunnana]
MQHAFNNYGLGPGQGLGQTLGGGQPDLLQQWNIRQHQRLINAILIFLPHLDVLSNMDMFDLENDLPDELMSSGGSWGMVPDPLGNNKPTAQGPGPGSLQNGVENTDGTNSLRQQMQLNHHLLQQIGNKNLGNALAMAGAQLGSKSPNLQSPPNVSVAKGVLDPMSLGNLSSNIPNNVGLQSIANNGSSPQVLSSIQGMNSNVATVSGSGMIMTNSSMGTIGNMAGGGLVVSSSVNKPTLTNTSMMATGQHQLSSNHGVPQAMQNGPMMAGRAVAMQHIGTRATGPHGVHAMGPRMQPPTMLQIGGVAQGIPNNPSYAYPNPNTAGPQGIQVVAPQPRPTNMGIQQARFGGPTGPVGPTSGGEGGMAQTQPPAPSPAQPQSGAPSGTQPGPQTATQNQPGTGAPAASTGNFIA